ncbi:MAG: DUF1702 family protein [Ktedonobacteraceae bacterium]|nr:DUF1702 family protein [Ktedonobacteraceae bacterium]
MTALGRLRRYLFGIPFGKALFNRPEFAKEASQRFESVAYALVEGYHVTLEDGRFEVFMPRLDAAKPELRGFAYEGAGMGLMLLDSLVPWKKHLQAFANGPGAAYIPLLYIGAGLALAKLRRQPERFLTQLDPVMRWFIIDGYGFYEGFFSYHHTVEEHAVSTKLSAYAHRIFDQGLGRSIWFSSGALVDRVAETIAAFPSSRRVDLWSGVGLASAYAGGVGRIELEALREAAGPYTSQLARGAAIAARGRLQVGCSASHTDLACEVFCGLSSKMAAHIADVALQNLPTDSVEPAYEIWRQRLATQFAVPADREIKSEAHIVPQKEP